LTTQSPITGEQSDLRLLAFQFLTAFKNNTDEDRVVSNILLSDAEANEVNMQNYMKVFGVAVNEHMKLIVEI